MLFNSIEFLLFLPVVFLLYWYVFRGRKWQNFLIVLASYVFYGWWDWRFLGLIALTSICSFASGLLVEKFNGDRKKQKAVSASNIILNLGILFLFKYFNFFVESFDSLVFSLFSYHFDAITLRLILPVGISFYTFQALSYTIDVYQKKIEPTHDLVEFFAYISFFPQLVAGPIERATNLLPQFQNSRKFDYALAVDGMRQMLWGFFKKVVVADNCAQVVNTIWADYSSQSSMILIVGAIFFTFQIYCDFSGYSDIAIGCAKLFGFRLMRNFNVPYFSRSIPEFWRRWHISLTSWFTDYIYIPLGGSRCAKGKIIRNVMIVWAISGLWHGANWTFVCWGLYHAVILSIYILLNINTKQKEVVAYGRILPSLKEFIQMTFTFMLAVFGWIIFRAESIDEAFQYIAGIFTNPMISSDNISLTRFALPAAAIVFMTIIEWIQRERQHALDFSEEGCVLKSPIIRYCVYILLAFVILSFAPSQQAEFIYFQF